MMLLEKSILTDVLIGMLVVMCFMAMVNGVLLTFAYVVVGLAIGSQAIDTLYMQYSMLFAFIGLVIFAFLHLASAILNAMESTQQILKDEKYQNEGRQWTASRA